MRSNTYRKPDHRRPRGSPREKILISILLIVIVGFAVWQFTSPQLLPPVAAKYSTSRLYSNRGSWALLETMTYGRIFLIFSIANLTYPRTTLSTSYSLVISDANQIISSSYIRGFGLKVTALTIQDNYDGSTTLWGKGNLTDAAQVATIFYFRTWLSTSCGSQ